MNSAAEEPLPDLVARARACRLCEAHLPLGPRPVFQIGATAVVLIAGQAPGRLVHESGVPFDDASGARLRDWLGVDAATFYDPERFAILPMGFCYPGTGKSGDFPPRPECAPAWRPSMLSALPRLKLTLAIGLYAQEAHLGVGRRANLTETVKHWRDFGLELMPLPHPSPRNNIWLKKNPWFEMEVVPELRARVAALLAEASPRT